MKSSATLICEKTALKINTIFIREEMFCINLSDEFTRQQRVCPTVRLTKSQAKILLDEIILFLNKT